MACRGEVLIDCEELNGLGNGVYMVVQCAVCVYLWLGIYVLGYKLCMPQKRMSKDHLSSIGDEIEVLIWIEKWRKNDKELNLE